MKAKAKKEELLDAKMRMIREKNERLMKRRQEIEDDKRNADLYSEMAVQKSSASTMAGVRKDIAAVMKVRSTGRGMMLQEMRKETLKAKEWETKRRENIKKEEEELKKKRTPPNSASKFLMDDNRVDMSRTTGRNEHSWGGANFNRVVNRVHRERDHFGSGRDKRSMEMRMTGKERQEYLEWKEERRRIDEERRGRQKKEGSWSRVWDQEKVWDAKRKMWVNQDKYDDNNYRDTQRKQENTGSGDWDVSNRRGEKMRGQRGFGTLTEGFRKSGFPQRDTQEQGSAGEDWDKITDTESVVSKQTDNQVNQENWEETSEGKLEEPLKTSESVVFVDNTGSHSMVLEVDSSQSGATSSENCAEDATATVEDTVNKAGNSSEGSLVSDTLNKLPNTQREISYEDVTKKGKLSINGSMAIRRDTDKEEIHDPPASDLGQESRATQDENSTAKKTTVSESAEKDFDLTEKTVDTNKKQIYPYENLLQTAQRYEIPENTLNKERSTLPKLKTTLDPKEVTGTDSETNNTQSEGLKEKESLGDIPPTPDFLRLDKDVSWGDFDINEEDVVERW